MKSIWQETPLPQFPALDGDTKTDVLIIGGGIAGILTAHFLQKNGVPYILVEKNRICSENTRNTTAKITVQHGLIYSRLMKSGGVYTAQKYLGANKAAFNEYARLCGSIDCDYEVKDNYVYSSHRSKLRDEMRALDRLGYNAEYCRELPLPVKTAGAVKFPQQAQFDPLKFIAEIAKELQIYENTFVRELDGKTAITDRGRITAEKTVIATHFPFINRHGAYFLKLYQHRSYVIALKDAAVPDGMYVDDDSAGLSFRGYKDLLLLGGGGGRTGKGCGGWEFLRNFSKLHYPGAKEEYFWAAQDCMSLDSVPYIGRYSKRTHKLYVETGFNKWGMTGAMVSAMLVSDMILGRKNEFADIFDPSRSILKPQLAVNGAHAVVRLLTPPKRVCPHMGCALKYNPVEDTWDCPCHGSRFSDDGKVLNNPSQEDLV